MFVIFSFSSSLVSCPESSWTGPPAFHNPTSRHFYEDIQVHRHVYDHLLKVDTRPAVSMFCPTHPLLLTHSHSGTHHRQMFHSFFLLALTCIYRAITIIALLVSIIEHSHLHVCSHRHFYKAGGTRANAGKCIIPMLSVRSAEKCTK